MQNIATDISIHMKKAGIRLPEMYDQLFSQYQRSGRVSLSTLNSILSKGKVSAQQIEMVGFCVLCVCVRRERACVYDIEY